MKVKSKKSKVEERLLPIVRCGDCTSLIVDDGKTGAKCWATGRQLKAQKYCNEGFPKDCPLVSFTRMVKEINNYMGQDSEFRLMLYSKYAKNLKKLKKLKN